MDNNIFTCCECKHQFGNYGLAIGEHDFFLWHYHGQLHYAQDAKHGQAQCACYGKISGHLNRFYQKTPNVNIIIINRRFTYRAPTHLNGNRWNTIWTQWLTHRMKPGYWVSTFRSSVVRLFAHLPWSKITSIDSWSPNFGCNTLQTMEL
jgi:hypothetical protein